MYTTQSKMISRAIWVEKKHVWKINLQKNGVRKSFYSSVPGDKGRKICAQNATSWLSGACPFSVSERTTVDTVFERYLQDKALETTNMGRASVPAPMLSSWRVVSPLCHALATVTCP